MKILNVLHLPWFAGTEKAYATYSELLQSLGYEVICLMPKEAEVKKHLDKKFAIVQDNAVLLTKGKLNIFSIWRLRKLVKSQGIKVVFVHSGGAVKLFKKILFGLRIPIIAVNHAVGPKNIAKADAAIALNKADFDIMQKYVKPPRSLYLLHNALNIRKGSYKAKTATPKTIGVMSRLVKEKGIDHFIEAFRLLKSKGYNLKAIIAGDGEEMANLLKIVKAKDLQNDIKFLGWIEDSKHFFSKIDIFCHPSLSESFGLVLLEAMQYAIPIVSTKTNGALEIVNHGINGLLADISSSESLARQIEKLIKNKSLGQALAKQAYKDLLSKYSYETIAKELKKIIEITLTRT